MFFKFLDVESWMRYYLGSTNTASCMNNGYRQLTYNGAYVTITSGAWGLFYGTHEWCYWAIHAPGAQSLRFELTRFNVKLLSMFSQRNP